MTNVGGAVAGAARVDGPGCGQRVFLCGDRAWYITRGEGETGIQRGHLHSILPTPPLTSGAPPAVRGLGGYLILGGRRVVAGAAGAAYR